MPVLSKDQKIQVRGRQILVQKELGSGAFGTVFKVYDYTSKQTCALKEVICNDERKANLAVREVNTLAKANHERIVRILAADVRMMQTGAHLFLMLTEFCSGGDLNSRLNRNSSRETNLKWISQISEALSYLHCLNPPIVHRDLKADNVLLKDPSTEFEDLKLGDFGLAREYLAMKNIDDNYEAVNMYYMSSGIGPIHWMAPEFFRKRYTEKADIFSLGGIFYAILARDFIVVGRKKMYGVSYQSQRKVGLGLAMAEFGSNAKVSFPSSFQGSNAMVRLIKRMLSYEPYDRPSASEVLRNVKEIQTSIKLENTPSQQSTGTCC